MLVVAYAGLWAGYGFRFEAAKVGYDLDWEVVGLKEGPAADLVHCPGGQIARDLRSALESGQPFAEREVVMPRPDGVEITVEEDGSVTGAKLDRLG